METIQALLSCLENWHKPDIFLLPLESIRQEYKPIAGKRSVIAG
ncbi:hypothetical protein [uncultured Odoribacter sp.]|nr:hypothetical protein [uncultured Odoribacter sp.]